MRSMVSASLLSPCVCVCVSPHACRYGEQMRSISLKYVPTAVLSRQTAGIRGQALVINLPGKPKSIRETFDEVFRSIPYCIQLAGGPYIETHKAVVHAFRPPADERKAKPA